MASETLEVTAPAPADAPPPVVEETPEEIEARLQRTQEALAGKLDVLEQQTLGTIRDTIGAVTDTVNTVQNVVANPVSAVQDVVQAAVVNPIEQVADGVQSTMSQMIGEFDPSDLIRKHPFESLGVAVAGGVAVGMLLSIRPTTPVASAGGPPTLFQTLTSSVSSELAGLGRQLFDTVSQSLLERVRSAVGTYGTATPPAGSPGMNGTR